ncbi:hypothetical protein ACKGJO_06550 [Gracilimonas sp. Q87]|uniref:hypothetical protein n=1 Tax=Gracilimonas sp. Q87 TaxID=3384766 RepID=UPI0039843A28
MIQNLPVTGSTSELSDLVGTEPTRIKTTESNIATFFSIIDSLTNSPVNSTNGTLRTALGVANFSSVVTEDPIDIESFANSLIDSPETSFLSYSSSLTIPVEVTRIFNHYGAVGKVFLLELKNQAFLSIGGKFLTIKK